MRFSLITMFAGAIVVLVGAGRLTILGSVQNQKNEADTKALKELRRAAAATFLDRNQPIEKRLAAAKNLGFPDDKTAAELLKIAADTGQDDRIRFEALRNHRYDEDYLKIVLDILGDAKNGDEDLDANLIEDLSRKSTFARIPEHRGRVQTALRSLLDDPRERVRLYAYRTLVALHDSVAIGRLDRSLRERQNVPIPLVDAVDQMDIDGAVNHIVALRPYLDDADPKVQGRVAQALAVDPQSRPKIVALATNRETPAEVRTLAFRALAREDQQFAQYALPILDQNQEDEKVRNEILRAFAGRMNYQAVDPAEQVRFAQAVEKIAGAENNAVTDAARQTKSDAQELFTHLRKTFPEIRKFYENR